MELRERWIQSHYVSFAISHHWPIPKVSIEQQVDVKPVLIIATNKVKTKASPHMEKRLVCKAPVELVQGSGSVRRCQWE